MLVLFSCVVEESYIRSQTRLVRFASNCSNRGYVLMISVRVRCACLLFNNSVVLTVILDTWGPILRSS